MNIKKYWLETLMSIAAAFGVVGVVIYLNMTAIQLWLHANWIWIVVVVAMVTARWWVVHLWKAYLAFSEHLHTLEMREQHKMMLAVATRKMDQGLEIGYKNDVHGFVIDTKNPYLKAGMAKVQEIAAQPQNALLAPVVPQAPVYAEVDPLITDQKLVLCYTQEGPVFGTVTDLLSMCVVGKPGRGKSTALLYYILILLKAGAEVWIWDPHSGLNDLAYGLNYCDDLGDIENSCPKLHSILEQRRKLWKEQKKTMHPLLLLVDEMPVIKDYEDARVKEVKQLSKKGEEDALLEYDQFYRPSRLLKKFVLEARKWNCYVILSGQALPAEVLSTLTRDNMSSRIVFESCNMHARMAGLQKEEIDGLLPALKGAGPGVAVMDVSRWSKPVLAAIPNTTVDDLRAFIDGGRPYKPFSEVREAFQDLSWSSEETEDLSPESPNEGIFRNAESAVKEAEKIVESIPHFSSEDERQILEIARVHLATYGKVIRSKIPASMNPPRNNAIYPVVKYICDREGL